MSCNACNQIRSSVRSGKGVVVWQDNQCGARLAKPLYASVVYYDGQGNIKYSDGSSENPFCLPNMRIGEGFETAFLVASTHSGCIYKIPVQAVELELCPPPGETAPVIITVLAVPNQ